MRPTRRWLLAISILAVLAGGAIAFYYKFVDTAYSRAEFYADTGLVPESARPDSAGLVTYGAKPGRVVLLLTRGEPHGIMTTEHDWWETVAIEIPEPNGRGRIDLMNSNVRLALFSYKWRQFPTIGAGGVRGQVDIESVHGDRIVAGYDLVIDGVYPRFVPEHRHRDVAFRGRSTFRARPRPADQFAGELWNRMGPVTPSKK